MSSGYFSQGPSGSNRGGEFVSVSSHLTLQYSSAVFSPPRSKFVRLRYQRTCLVSPTPWTRRHAYATCSSCQRQAKQLTRRFNTGAHCFALRSHVMNRSSSMRHAVCSRSRHATRIMRSASVPALRDTQCLALPPDHCIVHCTAQRDLIKQRSSSSRLATSIMRPAPASTTCICHYLINSSTLPHDHTHCTAHCIAHRELVKRPSHRSRSIRYASLHHAHRTRYILVLLTNNQLPMTSCPLHDCSLSGRSLCPAYCDPGDVLSHRSSHVQASPPPTSLPLPPLVTMPLR